MGQLYVKKLLGTGLCIAVYDVDPAKMVNVSTAYGVVLAQNIDVAKYCDMAIVATNTPSHAKTVIKLMECGVRHILCEKPLALTMSEIAEIEKIMIEKGAKIYTAFIMNFSLALRDVIESMQRQNLVVTEGGVTWGKNRTSDTRPTPGNLEDEMVHGAHMLHKLCGINQCIKEMHVMGLLTYPRFANFEAQKKAQEIDFSFPMAPNASTFVLEYIVTDKVDVRAVLHSSFIAAAQVRRVTLVLSEMRESSASLVYSVIMEFDRLWHGKVCDVLTIADLRKGTNESTSYAYDCDGYDKMDAQIKAFIDVAHAESSPDERLVSFEEAKQAVRFAEVVQLSSNFSGARIRV